MFASRIIGSGIALLAVALVSPTLTAQCHRTYHVSGQVLAQGGRPAVDAVVYVLLDEVSKKQFQKQGMRARRVRTNAAGRYSLALTCGEQPDPCGSKPKHLSVFVGSDRSRLLLRVFKLKSIDVERTEDSCFVQAPTIRLTGNP